MIRILRYQSLRFKSVTCAKLFFTEFLFAVGSRYTDNNNPSRSFKSIKFVERQWQSFVNNSKDEIAIGISLFNFLFSFICYFFILIEV